MRWSGLGRSLVVTALAAPLLAPASVPADDPLWSPPVAGPVVRPFVQGVGAYDVGGHAGVDYRADPGTTVRPAGRGVVAFVGPVAGVTFVVIEHGGGVRTSYGPLASTAMRRLEAVERADTLGTTGGAPLRGHVAGQLHFGLRIDGVPVDPTLLFDPRDLTQMVRLVPAEDPTPLVGTPEAERQAAIEWVIPPGPPAGLPFGTDGGGSALGGLVRQLRGGVQLVLTRGGAPALVMLREGAAVAWSAGQGVQDWLALRGECSALPLPAAGFPGTGNHLFAVSGLNSFTRDDGTTNDLAVDALGYSSGDVSWFSYAADGGAFTPLDTQVGPEAAAGRLASQLRAFVEEHPGRRVDLIGHSQGGVVIEAFLKLHYAGHEGEFPPLGEVVTLASPHDGAPLAALAVELGDNPAVEVVADLVGAPPLDTASVQQLAEGSAFLADLAGRPLPSGVDVTTIGAVGDLLVTADQTDVAGADHMVVDPDGLWEHGSIVSDATALGTVRLVLADQPAPCLTLGEAIRNRVQPRLIHAAYRVAPLIPLSSFNV